MQSRTALIRLCFQPLPGRLTRRAKHRQNAIVGRRQAKRRSIPVIASFSVSLVSRTRCNALALLRRAGTQGATEPAAAWAPALQRIAEVALRCVRGTRSER